MITLTASGAANTTVTINGNDGADTINGTAAGNAVIFGGLGVDTITGNGAVATILVMASTLLLSALVLLSALPTPLSIKVVLALLLPVQLQLQLVTPSLTSRVVGHRELRCWITGWHSICRSSDGGTWNMNTAGVAFNVLAVLLLTTPMPLLQSVS